MPLFLLLSLLALAGMATANVLLPSLVKLHFPDQIGPDDRGLLDRARGRPHLRVGADRADRPSRQDGWRSGLFVWAVTAGYRRAALARAHRATTAARSETSGHVGLLDVARTRLGWLMALFFGLQSLQAYAVFGWFAELYRDAGFSASTTPACCWG